MANPTSTYLDDRRRISLHLAGTVRFPPAPRFGKIRSVGDFFLLSETYEVENKQWAHVDRWIRCEHVSATLRIPNLHGRWTITPEGEWSCGPDEVRAMINAVLKRKKKKKKKKGPRWIYGIIFVPEDAPVLVESNFAEPYAAVAMELDGSDETYGTPGPPKCR